MKQGSTVRLIQPEQRGQVIERKFEDDIEIALVRLEDGAHRWFRADQLEVLEPAAAEVQA